MPALARASLTETESRVTERLVTLLRTELGPDLRSVWLYGSRARGEPPHDESDVDVLIVSERDLADDDLRVIRLVDEAAKAEGERPAFFATKVYTPEQIADRRQIRSFFMQEVDRDKIVVYGEP